MADIFISYSKADRDKVTRLAAYFESRGWTTWWDKNLSLGQPYRDEIMTELDGARAVVVLWTPASVQSDFVRAEAGHAKGQGKLIPVKVRDIGYGDIPLPFGEMHTEDLFNKEMIDAAVVAQLARPQVKPTPFSLAARTAQYQVLVWMGIVGGAVTLFANLNGILVLADWARWLTIHWHALTAALWIEGFRLVGLKLPPALSPLLTLALFCFSAAFGAKRQIKAPNKMSPIRYTSPILVWWLLSIALASIAVSTDIYYDQWRHIIGASGTYMVFLVSGVAFAALPLLALCLASDKLLFLSFSSTYAIFLSVIFVAKFSEFAPFALESLQFLGGDEEAAKIPLWRCLLLSGLVFTLWLSPFFVFPTLMLCICPLRDLTIRLSFLLVGLLALIGLNEISKLGTFLRLLLQPLA